SLRERQGHRGKLAARLLWELRWERDGFSVEAALAKGRPIPDWAKEEPQLLPGDEFYVEAFWELCSERLMPMGQIPWRSIVEYGRHKSLDDDILPVFHTVVREMDRAYLRWQAEQADRQRDK